MQWRPIQFFAGLPSLTAPQNSNQSGNQDKDISQWYKLQWNATYV